MNHLSDTPPPPESGVLPMVGVETARSSLNVAMFYWPGRWRRATVIAAFALEPLILPITAQGWAALLDRIDTAISADVADPALFP